MSIPIAAYWHLLNLIIPGNLYKLGRISDLLGGPQAILNSPPDKLMALNLAPALAHKISGLSGKLNVLNEWDKLSRYNLQTIVIGEAGYPTALSQIPDPPPLLYLRGQAKTLNTPGLSVVGSRKISTYGKEAIKLLIPQIVSYGRSIISGMAIGVDAVALQTCIDSQGVPIGVLASSLADTEIAPKENYNLAQQIIKHGCLISENPPGLPTYKLHFPLRNRIVSGLSQGVVVIEAALNSGSLVTAKLGLEQNKEIFAVPGSIFSANSHGTLTLIKQGARCTTNIQDIAQDLNWQRNSLPINPISRSYNLEVPALTSIQMQIVNIIQHNPATTDQIIAQTNQNTPTILTELTQLELLGFLRQTSNGVYHKAR